MIAIAACLNHPEREAIGVCVRCRTRVCTECVTKVDGINYCVTCLAILAVESTPRLEPKSHSRLGSIARLTLSLTVITLLTWGLLDLLLPGVS